MDNNNQNMNPGSGPQGMGGQRGMHGKGCQCWGCTGRGIGQIILLRLLISIIMALAIFYVAFKLGEMKGFIDAEFYSQQMTMYPGRMMYGGGMGGNVMYRSRTGSTSPAMVTGTAGQ